ncbi:uncharacterized protein LOC134531622 [Bacillus rossius redtenbacheri]|uniref:uncharacterized protein LOC134531622 n=1 Tax=Bacillus rossius redtenbacheri TaxID=93214 RepID=UPI002FDD455A
MSCTVVTEPGERDDKTLLILWENEGNISIDEETLEKLSETEARPVSVLRLSAAPVEQGLADGVGSISITVKEVCPDIMARLVEPGGDPGQEGVAVQSLQDILSPDERASFLSWTVALDHWYTGEPLPPAPSFLGPMLEAGSEQPSPLSPAEEARPAVTPAVSPVLLSPALTPTRGRGRVSAGRRRGCWVTQLH